MDKLVKGSDIMELLEALQGMKNIVNKVKERKEKERQPSNKSFDSHSEKQPDLSLKKDGI